MSNLLPCPFCEGEPKVTERPSSHDERAYFCAVACYCGGYSACAHKMATEPTEDEARSSAFAAWNRRAQPAPGAWQPIETAPKPDIGADGFGVRLLLAVDCGEGTIASVQKGYWEGADWYLDSCIGLATSCGYRVTHWQPLPEPPKGEKQ